mmetsp:Transcript_14442/g.20129  ORF Transcript_14442/g.20129 Transcript_14442/m.20129 type:complete len:146 (+) Transcript_14442:677-1114(+)
MTVLSSLNNRIVNTSTFPTKQSKSVNKPRKTITSITRQSKASTEEKEQPQQVFREEPRSVFRESPFLSMDNQLQDMLALKRANPIFDSDDEEDYESPTKKVRTFDADVRDDELSQEQRTIEQILDWDDRQAEDEIEGFQLIKIIQ